MSTMEETSNLMQNEPIKHDDHYFGKITNDSEHMKECAIMSVLRNQKVMLEEDLQEAKMKFANAALRKDNWVDTHEKERVCNVLEGQISILCKMEREFENMLSVMVA